MNLKLDSLLPTTAAIVVAAALAAGAALGGFKTTIFVFQRGVNFANLKCQTSGVGNE
jgi:hypothetical protein